MPDSQVAQSETLEQIANRICRHYLDSERVSVTQFCDIEAAILSALRKQTERCAEIAETCHPQPCICQTCLIRAEAGAAIRKLLRPSGKDGNKW